MSRLQSGHDPRHVRDQALRQVTNLGARIGDDLLAGAVIELLRHLERLAGRPAEARAAEFLQRRQIVQLRRPLPLVLDAHAKHALEIPRRIGDGLGRLAPDNSLLRRVPHLEVSTGDFGSGDNLEIGKGNKIADFQLATANDRQGRRLHASNTNHSPRTLSQDDGRGAGQRQIVDLVGLPARHGGGVEQCVIGVRLCRFERRADRLRILRGEQHAHDFAAVVVVLENFLADQLAFAVAIGREPDALGGPQRFADRSELGGLVSA